MSHPIPKRFAPSFATMLALTALAAAPTQAAAQSSDGRPDAWTKRIDVSLSARDLGLRPGASAGELARAAIERRAKRLGLPRPLRGLRLARQLPVARVGGAARLRLLRFQQTVGGLRVLWSQIDVDVAAGKVSSIGASVVPTGRRLAGERRVSRARALRIARSAVPGSERTLQPVEVAYAGNPTTRTRRPRSARRAWVVETAPQSQWSEESPADLCIVIDAETGEVVGRWWGSVTRPSRDARAGSATDGARDASAVSAATTTLVQIKDGIDLPVRPYAEWRTGGDPFHWRGWPRPEDNPTYASGVTRSGRMDALTRNALQVARFICIRHKFCGRRGGPAIRGQTVYYPWDVRRVDTPWSQAQRDTHSLFIGDQADHVLAADVIAHEFGHVMDWVYAGDRVSSPNVPGQPNQGSEVEEALADMFAQNSDPTDPTLGEDLPGGYERNWEVPKSRFELALPGSMREYDCTPSNPYYNSAILSHAYYLFAQDVGWADAGHVLQYIPWFLGPQPRFIDLKAGFITRSAQLYPYDDPNDPGTFPEVGEAAGRAFVDAIDMDYDPPGC